jgi:ATP/maltotriose-dependent transcriptional regulator MalT
VPAVVFVAQLLEGCVKPLSQQGELQTLLVWIKVLPLEVLRAHPHLATSYILAFYVLFPFSTQQKEEQIYLHQLRAGVEMSGTLESFRALPAEVLLLGGSKSPKYLKAALDSLEHVLPHATRIEFSGLGHGSPWNFDKQRNPDGNPEVVAAAQRRFFAES